jgi:hypothetical protein
MGADFGNKRSFKRWNAGNRRVWKKQEFADEGHGTDVG